MLLARTMPHKRITFPKLPSVKQSSSGRIGVSVFSVNSC